MPKTYRVAVIGRTGKGNYGHGLDVVWKEIDYAQVVAVADEDDKGREAAAKRLGGVKAYADYREMLEKEKPQIVSVADRFLDMHKDMVIACARAGASIFLEKPMARDLAEADALVTACEMHHVKLAIAHQTRYSPRLKVIKDYIGEGKLGDLLMLHGRGKEDARGGGQDLMVLGTHVFDLMRFLAGDPQWCHSRVLHEGKPATRGDIKEGGEGMGPILGDTLTATYGFPKGVLATFGSHKAPPETANKRFGLHVHGTRGIIQLGTGSLPDAWLLEDPTWMPGKSKAAWKLISSAGVGKDEPLKDGGLGMGNVWVAKDLIAAIENDRQPLGSMYDGRAALEMILAVYESWRQKAVVDIPLKNREHPLNTK